MGTLYLDWDASWSTTSIASSSIADAGSASTAAISGDLKAETEVSITITYGAIATEGVKVYILRDVDGTNYEAATDSPWVIEMPSAVSATKRKTINVGNLSSFKVHLTNGSGASITATVDYKQSVVTTV